MKIYIVVEGFYDWSNNAGVFKTKELAENFIAKNEKTLTYPEIQEHTIITE